MKKVIIIAQSLLESIGGAQSLFGRGGITLYPARTSEEILEMHRDKKADLIISDLSLPAMGGTALLKKIRGDAELRDVSIIMACDGPEASRSQCRDAGANAVVGKPVDTADLFMRVSELIVVPRRKHMRVLLRVTLDDGQGGENRTFASSENISISGMLIETKHAYRQGDRLQCHFHIGHSEVKVEGMIVRLVPGTGGRHRYGIQFVNLDTKTMVVIEQFVRTQKGTPTERY